MATVRPATLADAPVMAEIHVASWHAMYRGMMPDAVIDGFTVTKRLEQWTSQLTERPDLGLVAEEAGHVVGWCTFGPYHDDTAPGCGEVYAIYLAPSVFRRGIGRQLWHAAVDRLAARGLEPVAVWVLEANARARRFYESVGATLDPGAVKIYERGGARMPEVRYWTRPAESL